MTKDDIIPSRTDVLRMARKAHRELVTKDYPGHMGHLDPWTLRLIERFAVLVAEEAAIGKEMTNKD